MITLSHFLLNTSAFIYLFGMLSALHGETSLLCIRLVVNRKKLKNGWSADYKWLWVFIHRWDNYINIPTIPNVRELCGRESKNQQMGTCGKCHLKNITWLSYLWTHTICVWIKYSKSRLYFGVELLWLHIHLISYWKIIDGFYRQSASG